eukprot:6825993-Alexandrium_andersonii.AAC.1
MGSPACGFSTKSRSSRRVASPSMTMPASRRRGQPHKGGSRRCDDRHDSRRSRAHQAVSCSLLRQVLLPNVCAWPSLTGMSMLGESAQLGSSRCTGRATVAESP